MTDKQKREELLKLVREVHAVAADSSDIFTMKVAAVCAALRERLERERDGWVLVPKEPTPEMIESGEVSIFESSFAHEAKDRLALAIYRDMLDAVDKR